MAFKTRFLSAAKFTLSSWSYAFPLAATTMASIVYAHTVQGDFTRGLAYAALGVTTYVGESRLRY